jgi:hypothetical protein
MAGLDFAIVCAGIVAAGFTLDDLEDWSVHSSQEI